MWYDSSNYQVLAIRDIVVSIRIGAFDDERRGPQSVEIDVELYRRNDGYRGEGLDECLDYSKVYDYLTGDLSKKEHQDLLESWAEDLVQFCMSDPKVEACRIRVRKTETYPGRAFPEIEVVRHRA